MIGEANVGRMDGRARAMISAGIHHRFAPVRKGVRILMHVPRALERLRDSAEARRLTPPILANSIPKSGTHLLDQILSAIPRRRNYGRFLESMTASYIFKERSVRSTTRFIETIVSGEIVRAHLHHSPEAAQALDRRSVAHFLICRDPRDVVVSEAHYLRSMNRWHKMHPYFKRLPSFAEAVTLAITGLPGRDTPLPYPDIGRRYGRFMPWFSDPSTHVVRFEDLISGKQPETIEGIVRHYEQLCGEQLDVEGIATTARDLIAPSRSHTFREGRSGGWKNTLSGEQKELVKSVAGDLLIQLGYEESPNW